MQYATDELSWQRHVRVELFFEAVKYADKQSWLIL